jgi:hypothetical protein
MARLFVACVCLGLALALARQQRGGMALISAVAGAMLALIAV